MSDTRGAPDSPDFFDRLLARHASPRPAAVRVRPRLPGPFERVEAVRAAAPAPDEDTLLWPATTPAAAVPPDAPRPSAVRTRTHTERERTVVRTEREPAAPAPPSSPVRAEAPLLRPVAPVAPGPRPLPEAGRRAAGRGRAEPGASQTAVSAPIPPGTEAAPRVVSAALRPSAADTAAARDAVRQAAARRPSKPTEQVVQVQIGRLEVTAATAAEGAGQRRKAAERPGTALSLADYLARGRE
ncbi:hypothetical protein ACFY1U_25940 [Streptomyces sp. NPDC001351]|uniref:hypothetical protein n=1 Tax=Streptomyces sp. NPDC001351 TaxID=3364564 RepID=UPI0036CE77C1